MNSFQFKCTHSTNGLRIPRLNSNVQVQMTTFECERVKVSQITRYSSFAHGCACIYTVQCSIVRAHTQTHAQNVCIQPILTSNFLFFFGRFLMVQQSVLFRGSSTFGFCLTISAMISVVWHWFLPLKYCPLIPIIQRVFDKNFRYCHGEINSGKRVEQTKSKVTLFYVCIRCAIVYVENPNLYLSRSFVKWQKEENKAKEKHWQFDNLVGLYLCFLLICPRRKLNKKAATKLFRAFVWCVYDSIYRCQNRVNDKSIDTFR